MKPALSLLAALVVVPLAEPRATEANSPKPNDASYDINTAKQVELAEVKARLDLDAYGGSKSIKGQPTGWFALQKIRDRWWLVTPDGHGMVSLGVTHILATCNLPIYAAAYHRDLTSFTKDAADNLRRWGFNSAGYGGVNRQNRLAMLNEMPAVVSMELIDICRYSKNPERIDLFDASVRGRLSKSIAGYVEPVKASKNLIGYMYVDLPVWWDLDARKKGNDWAIAYRKLAAGAAGKVQYVNFLLQQRKTVGAINKAYGTRVTDRAGLLAETAWANVRPDDPAVLDDDRAFVAIVARQYYKFCHDEIRKLDPNHLIFGDRYASVDLGLEEVIKEAAPYIDGVAIQPIPKKGQATQFDKAAFDRVAAITGKPLLICDFAVNFATPQFPSGMWGSWPTEDRSADLWAEYLDDAFAQPYMVGIHRCEYIDLPVDMPGGRVLKQGLVRQDGRPYVRTVQRYAEIHKHLFERMYGVEAGGKERSPRFALAGQNASASPHLATHNAMASFDPSKGLKDYAGKTIIGSKSSADGRSDSVIAGEHAEKCAELQLTNCTGLQVQVYPSFQGSWPNAVPTTLDNMTFKTEGLSALVNWGRDHQQKTLHHLMIGPNMYFPPWFWKSKYTAEELDQLLEWYITALMTANDNQRKMDGWNIFNEMFVYKAESGEYRKDGPGPQDCVWMRMGFEADQSGLKGKAKVNEKHPVVFRKALQYASMARGKLEIRDCEAEEVNRKSDALYQLIKHLRNSGVRVDALGFQGHLHVNRSYDWESVKENIRRFKDLGLEVYITELDVSVGTWWKKGSSFPQDYEKLQAARFYGIVRAARETGVHRIDVWGLSEAVNQHWLVGQKARLFDEQFKPRPTYQAVLKALYDTQQ